MPYNEWDDNSTPLPLSLDQMRYELAKRGNMPLRADGSDVPYVASEVPSIRVPVQPKEPRPSSTATNIPQALADRFGISAVPQSLIAMASGFPAAVARSMGYEGAGQAMQYEPTSLGGKEILEAYDKFHPLGSSMGIGPIPELWNMRTRGINPDDVRVMGANMRRIGNEIVEIPPDFRNAQSGGPKRQNAFGEPTLGVKVEAVASNIGDVLFRRQAMGKSTVPYVSEFLPETNMYAVRNTGEGQMIRPTATVAGVKPSNVNYNEVQELLGDISPAMDLSRPEEIIAGYKANYMTNDSPSTRALQNGWGRFVEDKAKELFPNYFTVEEATTAFKKGYTPNQVKEIKFQWFSEYIKDAQSKGFVIPSMEEYLARAELASQVTNKIIPNLMQRYIGTPNDPFLEIAKKGITVTPAEELMKYEDPSTQVRLRRNEGGFEAQGEVADKLMPVAESKLANQSQELDNLIAEQNQIGRTEGMLIPYPDGRIDPETGQVAMATNPNYAQFTNKIGALRKMIEDTETDIRNLRLAKSYENVSDESIRMGKAGDFRSNISPEDQQFFPQLFADKPKATSISPLIYKTPNEAKMFSVNAGFSRLTGVVDLSSQLINDIMQGKIPPEQVPTLAQPHTITKYMADMVAPRLEKEKAARLAMKEYRVNVENHFVDVLNAIPDSMRVGTNAKLLWIDDATPYDEIKQHLSDETFVLDHCIGQSGNGRGLENLFNGDDRKYIPLLDPATGQKMSGASEPSSYMDNVESGNTDIMMIRDDKTGMPVGTIELSRTQDADTGESAYDIGFVSGYQNRTNKYGGIDPKYREALRDALNLVKDRVVSTADNEAHSGVYDMRNRDQLASLKKKLDLPERTSEERQTAWVAVQRNIMDNLDGDRYITLEQAEEALKEYKAENPSVPVKREIAQIKGIPLAQWSDLVGQTMYRIQVDHGQAVRDRVAGILAEAIGSQMDIPVNERPNQVSSYLANARSANNSQQVRRALGTLGSAIDQANADILNAQNAPTTALPTLAQYGEVVSRASHNMSNNQWADVEEILNNIQTEIVRDGGMYHQQPATIVQRLDDAANYQEAEGEPNTALGLRNLASEIATLVPANPPASMALANAPRNAEISTRAEPRRTPRDIAETVHPNRVHQSLEQRQAQVDSLISAINDEIRGIGTNEPELRQLELFYQDPNNLPTSIIDFTTNYEDAGRIANYLLQHVQSRLPQIRQQDLQAFYERASDEIRGTYTNNYLEQFQNGDMDVRNSVLQDVTDRPSVYGLARLNPQQQRDMVERLRTAGLHDPWVAEEPQRLPEDEGHSFYTMGQIQGAIGRRMSSVNREHLGISQQFDSIVEAANREFNSQTQPERFITSLLQRASSVENNNRTEVHPARRELARQLRLMADDVQTLVETAQQTPALPAPDPIQADLDRLYNSVSESIRTRHPTMINEVMNSRNTRSNLADVIRTDPIRYGLGNYSTDVVNLVADRLIEDGLSNGQMPVVDPVAQHYDRVENGVNQPAGLGALSRDDSEMVRRIATNQIAGAHQTIGESRLSQRDMASILIGSGEATGNALPAVEHTRLVNTLTSQTYNPATDGEALIRLLQRHEGMFANLEEFQRQEGIRIVNNWNLLRFPNYRPPEAGMGLEPEGHKRGGLIRKKILMNEGGTPTPEEARRIIAEMAEAKRLKDEATRPRTYAERLNDMYDSGQLKRPTPKGGAGLAPSIEPAGTSSIIKNPLNFKSGGGVSFADNYDAMRYEMLRNQ